MIVRTRRCLDDCSNDEVSYRECMLEDIDCWKEWENWGDCHRPDDRCGKNGLRYRYMFANCSAVKSLTTTCFLR